MGYGDKRERTTRRRAYKNRHHCFNRFCGIQLASRSAPQGEAMFAWLRSTVGYGLPALQSQQHQTVVLRPASGPTFLPWPLLPMAWWALLGLSRKSSLKKPTHVRRRDAPAGGTDFG